MNASCKANRKTFGVESSLEKRSESTGSNVRDSHSDRENVKNSFEPNDEVREDLTDSANVNFLDISICSREATDGYVVEASKSATPTDKKKDLQELLVRKTNGPVKPCLFSKNVLERTPCTLIENKMNSRIYKSEHGPSSKQRSFNLRRGEQQVTSSHTSQRGDVRGTLFNVSAESKKLTSGDKVSASQIHGRTGTEEQTAKAPIVCGAASLRLQRLKKQLEEARSLRERQNATDTSTGLQRPLDTKTRLPVVRSTAYSEAALCRPTRVNKFYSESAPSASPGGNSEVKICPSYNVTGPVVSYRSRDYKPLTMSSASSSASGIRLTTRSGIQFPNSYRKPVFTVRDNQPYSLSVLSNSCSSVSSMTKSGIYPPNNTVGYRKQTGVLSTSLMEAPVTIGRRDSLKRMHQTHESNARKDSLNHGLSRVDLEVASSSQELRVVPLYTRRKELRTYQPNKIIEVSDEQLKQCTSRHDSGRTLESCSPSKRVCTEVEAVGGWKKTLESSGGVPRKNLQLPKNQESQALVPANQWGSPRKSVSYSGPTYYNNVDQNRGKRYYFWGETEYYRMWFDYYRSYFQYQRQLYAYRNKNIKYYDSPYYYHQRNERYNQGEEYSFPRRNNLPPYQIVYNGVNKLTRGIRQFPANQGNVHDNIQFQRRIFYNDRYRANHFEPPIHTRFRRNYPYWIQRDAGRLRYNLYGQQAGKVTEADFVKPLGRPHPSQRSHGGISKVSTRVQKQVRTAASVLKVVSPHLARTVKTPLPKNVTEESKKKPDSACDIVNEAKAIPSDISKEESMDWDPIEPEKIVEHVGELRKQSGFQNTASSALANLCNPNVLPSKWFIIVDTNIFLSHLSLVENLCDTKDPTVGMPTLLVPWVVLNELDCLKGSNTNVRIKNPASRAINFVWRCLVSKHPRLEGQHPSEAKNSRDVMADDSILECCMKMKDKSEKVVLLTNDLNLQNKAIISGIECFSAKEFPKRIAEHQVEACTSKAKSPEDTEKGEIQSFLCQLKECMKLILEEILCGEMLDAYGPMWTTIIARKPPLTLCDILFCYLKHWIAVFGTVLPGICRELFEKLQGKLAEVQTVSSWYNVELLVRCCCEVVENLPLCKYEEKVNGGVRTLNELCNICNNKTNLPGSAPSQSPVVSAAPSAMTTPSSRETVVHDREEERHSEAGSCRSSKSNASCGSSLHGDTKTGNESFDDYLSLHASSLSDAASDIGSVDLEVDKGQKIVQYYLDGSVDLEVDKGQKIVQYYLDEIFKKIATFCGLLCNMMGIQPCVTYDQPECFPTVDILQQNMPLVFPRLHSLLLHIQRVLIVPVHDLSEEHPVIVQLYHTIKDSFPMSQSAVGPLLPLHIVAYCTDDNTRQFLERGAQQFEQFQAIFNKAVLFFMEQNHSCPLPSF